MSMPTVPAAQQEIRLQVTGLEVRMGRSGPDVVRDVSFAVRAGEVLGLVGESGSGKTTVALALLGHARRGLRITAGQILLDGTDLLTLSGRDLRAARGARTVGRPGPVADAGQPGNGQQRLAGGPDPEQVFGRSPGLQRLPPPLVMQGDIAVESPGGPGIRRKCREGGAWVRPGQVHAVVAQEDPEAVGGVGVADQVRGRGGGDGSRSGIGGRRFRKVARRTYA